MPTHAPPLHSPDDASRVDEVYTTILARIVRGQIGGGAEIKGARLAKELGVSRTPVVQALARLAADGIVAQTHNRRAVVRIGAENWLVEIHQLRELLEPTAAELAASRIPSETLAELQRLAEESKPQRRSDWTPAAWRFDYALHLAIADHCGNLALGEAIRKCWTFKRVAYEAGEDSPEVLAKGRQQHLAILEALRHRDGPSASAAVLHHLRSARPREPATRIV